LAFIDALQKQHSRALGFFPRAQMEGYVENQWVLIAEDAATKQALGYCASRDRYLKRDELGVVYQLCVTQSAQRGLIGATLIREVFHRAAYGCRLFCCWCAQDLEANRFWESLGFVPIAFRGGSGKKKRVHIFWQRRIREGDTTTPWWFPAKTDQGAMREDRLVLPIPPGLRWSDEMPVLRTSGTGEPSGRSRRVRQLESAAKDGPQAPTKKPRAGIQFGVPRAKQIASIDPAPAPAPAEPPKPPAEPPKPAPPKVMIDPQMVAKARELRDRYLEQVNGGAYLLEGAGRYDVSRALADREPHADAPRLALPAPLAA
jgi:hypothetical protein